jgi:hypothetical protein
VSRIGRLALICMLLITVLAIVWKARRSIVAYLFSARELTAQAPSQEHGWIGGSDRPRSAHLAGETVR